VALALAFLLKPHLALWTGVGMFVLPERAARAVVVRAAVLIVGFTALTAAVMAAMGTLRVETSSYVAMLSAETSAGASMNATSREVLPAVAQITSLESVVGFWIANPAVRLGLTCTLLLALGFLLLRRTRRVNTERGALVAMGAWSAMGMLATYHRAHDGVILLLAVPWVVDRVRRTPYAWHAWAAVAAYCGMSASADFPVVERWVAAVPAHSLAAFLLLRQVALADIFLVLVFVLAMTHEQRRQVVCLEEDSEAAEFGAAA
jgi:hypothetical protein